MSGQIWYRDPDTKQLVSPFDKHPESKHLEPASPITVTLDRVVVGKDYESIGSGNDLFIMSRSAMGVDKDRPKVDRFHAFKKNIPVDQPVPGMFNNIMFVNEDYNGQDRLWLELHIREVDVQKSDIDKAVASFKKMASVAGSVFPVALPYLFGASAAAELAGELLGWLQKDDPVMDLEFPLYPGDPVVGQRLLQTGTYVLFNLDRTGSLFTLEQDGCLYKNGQEAKGVTYAVINILDQKRFEPKEELSQKISTLLAQMKQDENESDSIVNAFSFLTNTMTKYDQFGKLDRYKDLNDKINSGQTVSEKEKQLMESIAKIEALKPYLPS